MILAELVYNGSSCFKISAAQKGWDSIVAETKRIYADEKLYQRIQGYLGLNGISGLYDVGPRRFMKYAVQVLSLRASGIAKAIKLAQAPAAAAEPAAATA